MNYTQFTQQTHLIEFDCYGMLSLLNEYASLMKQIQNKECEEFYQRSIYSYKFYDV